MTRSAVELIPDEQDVRIAHFAAAAILLSVAESGSVVRSQTVPSESWRPRQSKASCQARGASPAKSLGVLPRFFVR
jgi:hypothetical protein